MVTEFGSGFYERAQRREGEPAADRDPPHAEIAQLADGWAAGTGDDVDRSVHFSEKAAQVVRRGHVVEPQKPRRAVRAG